MRHVKYRISRNAIVSYLRVVFFEKISCTIREHCSFNCGIRVRRVAAYVRLVFGSPETLREYYDRTNSGEHICVGCIVKCIVVVF